MPSGMDNRRNIQIKYKAIEINMNNFGQSISEKRVHTMLSEEIDLMELAATLWGGRWTVVLTMVFVGLVSLVVLILASSIYEIDAVLDQPSELQLKRIQPSILVGGDNFQVNLIEPETVYITALTQSNSVYVKKLFWESYVNKNSIHLEDEKLLEILVENFFENLQVKEPDLTASTTKMLSLVSMESEVPRLAVDVLYEYLNFIDQHTISDFVNQLREGYMTALARLDLEYQSIEKLERFRLEDALTRLREAHDLAESLNIVETPYEQVENVALNILDNRQYILGTRALAEEIKSLEARKDKPLFAFVPALRDMQRWREQIELDMKKLDQDASKAHAFVIVSPPEASLEPVKPNKPLIFVAVLFASGILGVVIVFTREGIRSYKARSAPVE